MQRLVLRTHSMRSVTLSFSSRQCLFDCNSHLIPRCITGLVNLFQSQNQKVHTTASYCRGKERSERRNDEQIFSRNTNTYIANQSDEFDSGRKSNQRKKQFIYRHDEARGSSDYPTRRDHHRNRSMKEDQYNVRQQYNEQKEAEQSSEIQDNDELDDNFGNLSRDFKGTLPKWLDDENLGEYDMEKPHRRLAVEDRRHDQYWYFKKIVELGKEGKVLEAIAVLDDWMLVKDRVMPNEDIFTAVIGIIGRTGNAALAFKYFKKMRDYGLKPNEATFTALFNACSNCPDKEIALKKGTYLRDYMRRAQVIPNMITYNAIIKMYGRFGDLSNAFLVADEALSNRRPADSFFFGSLLSAAISDKEEGLLYAIEVWRRMKVMRIKPDIFHYKLMLHAIAECQLGSEEQQKILLQPYVPYKQQKANQKQIEATTDTTLLQSGPQHPRQKCYGDLEVEEVKSLKSPKTLEQRKQKQVEESQLELHAELVPDNTTVSLVSEEQVDTSLSSMTVTKFPDLLDPKGSFSDIVSLGNISEGKDRLLLMGGIKGFLRRMEADEVSPDITVLTWLVQMTRGKEDEEIILSALEEGKVKADSTFLNALMRTKAQTSSDDAKAVMQLFAKYNVVPNRQTFGSLMFCTRHSNEAKEILDSMENAGLVPDIKTFGILIGKGAGHFRYKKHLLRKMEAMNIKPDIHFLQIVERHLQRIRDQILKEQHQNTKNSKIRRLEKEFQDLNVFYKEWLLKTKVHKENHPLKVYRKEKKLTNGRE